jgi:nucleoside-diphosphate-sugar epimerase
MPASPPIDVARELADDRVLLVGGAGFIGHHIALELRAHGIETAVFDNLMVNNLVTNVSAGPEDPVRRAVYLRFLLERFDLMRDAGVHLVNGDARNLQDLAEAFHEFQPTKVVHLAGIASAVDARSVPGVCFDLQVVTLRHTVELVRLQHAQVNQVMFISSSTVYGDMEAPAHESMRPRPRGIYANTKYMGERLLRTYRDSYGLGATVVRPSALFGPRCISRRVSQVFIENALTGQPLRLEGGGQAFLDFTHVDDLAHGIVLALANHKSPDDSNTFNLTYGDARRIADFAAVVKRVFPDAILEEKPRAEDKPVRGTLDINRARETLGYAPKRVPEEAYAELCEWYAERWHAGRATAAND